MSSKIAWRHRCKLQEVGVVRSYPIEWDSILYPPRFKAPTLQAFNGKGSPNQHIYYFKSQTGNVVSNDAIMTRLFIDTLKGVAFKWFMKLHAGSMKIYTNLKKLFLVRSFKDNTEVYMPTLLVTKERKESQNICREISGYGAPMSKRHDSVYIGRSLPSQLANHALGSNMSS